MINLLLGPPGAGKSYEAVVYHVLPALARGRKVITNLPLNMEALAALDPDFPGLVELRDKTLAERPETLSREAAAALTKAEQEKRSRWSDRAFANPEDFASDWRHEEGFGPLYVVDECHFCMPVGRTQIGVEEWFSMHRHYNADVLLISQGSSKISRAIRDLVQVCYKVRKAVALGKPDGYIRKVHDGVGGGVISEGERTYKPQMFGLWRSHTQGVAIAEHKADDVAPFIVKFKRFTRVVVVLALAACVWAFWPSSKPPAKPAAVKPPAGPVQAAGAIGAGRGTIHPQSPATAPPRPVQAAAPAVEEVPEPYGSKSLHVTGRLTMGARTLYTFAVSDGGRVITDLTSEDLKRAGYRWEPLTDCAGTLHWRSKSRALTCDAPALAVGTQKAPVVLGLPAGTPPASSLGRAGV